MQNGKSERGGNIEDQEGWIMEVLQSQDGKVTRDNVVELLNVTPLQAYRLLKKLSDKGRLRLIGNGRAAYF